MKPCLDFFIKISLCWWLNEIAPNRKSVIVVAIKSIYHMNVLSHVSFYVNISLSNDFFWIWKHATECYFRHCVSFNFFHLIFVNQRHVIVYISVFTYNIRFKSIKNSCYNVTMIVKRMHSSVCALRNQR